jgi:hypothetical protein
MKFYSDKIVTRSISLEDAAKKAKDRPQMRSLDEIINNVQQVKTASTNAEVKTAAAEAPKAVEAPKAEAKVVEAKAAPVQVKVAEDLAKAPEAPKTEAKKPVVKAEAKKLTLKIAKTLDFRPWEAQKIVDAWKSHGSVEKCIANVKGKVNDGKTYCGLLQVAATQATKAVKLASATKEKKVASTPEQKKFAKLTPNEQTFLREYFTKIYGKDYVEAMLGDY